MPIDIAKIEALARKALDLQADRAWLDTAGDAPAYVVGHIDDSGETYPVVRLTCEEYDKTSQDLAEFYAGVNPKVVLLLVSEFHRLQDDLETERNRLAACGVAALSDTENSIAKLEDICPKYTSGSLQDIVRQMKRLIEMRGTLSILEGSLQARHRDSERLDFLEKYSLETESSGDLHEEPTFGVHRVAGGRNDREWTCLGRGDTLREAVDSAMEEEHALRKKVQD